MKTTIEALRVLNHNNDGLAYYIYRVNKKYGGAEFIQVYPIGKYFRRGNTGSTIEKPSGLSIEVNSAKAINDLFTDLINNNYKELID